jgi:hypothetical protein
LEFEKVKKYQWIKDLLIKFKSKIYLDLHKKYLDIMFESEDDNFIKEIT